MAFCKNCGAQVEDDAKYCPTCGAPIGAEPVNQDINPIGGGPSDNNSNNYGTEQNYNATQTNPGNDVDNNRGFAILAYFGILVLIPLCVAPNSQFAKFHSNQGLILFIFFIICAFVGIVPIIGWLASFVGTIFGFVLFIMGIINAAKGEMRELPLIGSIRLIK